MYFFISKDLIAAAGRAKIEELKQTALTNIQKNRDAALKQLDIHYASADKAKTSFGYIGISFLAFIFGSVFANDFLKLCVYYFSRLRVWWRQRRLNNNNNNIREQNQRENEHVQIELERSHADDLEKRLERVYIRLVQANASQR